MALDSLTRKQRIVATALAVGIAPLFLYPCFYVVVLGADTVFGDRIIVDHLVNVSKRDIWDLFWSDWASSIVPSFVFVIPTLVAALALNHYRKISLWALLPGLALATSLAVSMIVLSGNYIAVVLATALLFSLPVTWILSKCAS